MRSHGKYLLVTLLEAAGIRLKTSLEASHFELKSMSMNSLIVYLQHVKMLHELLK